MILTFSQNWPKSMGELAGQPTYFVEKILNSIQAEESSYYPFECNHCHFKGMSSLLLGGEPIGDTGDYDELLCPKCESWEHSILLNQVKSNYMGEFQPKLHTIHQDTSDRWRAGMDIHFVINNRTKKRFQFAPVMKCVGVQSIEIMHLYEKKVYGLGHIVVKVDGRRLHDFEIMTLARNDGFPSVESFFAYFKDDFRGVLIHWSDLKY